VRDIPGGQRRRGVSPRTSSQDGTVRSVPVAQHGGCCRGHQLERGDGAQQAGLLVEKYPN
jgi:hypothetical protein